MSSPDGTFSGKQDYPFFLSRLKGMKRGLLEQEEIHQLSSYSSLENVIDHLLETGYADHIRSALSEEKGTAGLLVGIEGYYTSRITSIREYLEMTRPGYILPCFLSRDIFNLISLLRYRHFHRTGDIAPRSFIPPKEMGGLSLEEALKIEDLSSLHSSIADHSPAVSIILAKAAESSRYETAGNLSRLEGAVMDAYYRYLDRYTGPELSAEDIHIIRDYVVFLIYVANIKTILHFIGTDLPDEKRDTLFIEGGGMDRHRFNRLLSLPSAEDVFDTIDNHFILSALETGSRYYITGGEPTVFNRFFDGSEIQFLTSRAVMYPLSIAVVLQYLALLKNECINIRIICRSIHHGIPEGKMRSGIVYV